MSDPKVAPKFEVLADYVLPAGCAYMLRNCGPEGRAYNGFMWPTTPGETVVCPDWQPTKECGHGLHGWLHGEGNVNVAGYDVNAADGVWLVVEVVEADVVEIERKVKVPRGRVIVIGDRGPVVAWLSAQLPGRSVLFGTATAGDDGTATAGARGTATAGDDGSIAVRWWDGEKTRYRLLCADVGENGIEANKPYHVVDGKFVQGKAP